MNIEGIQSLIFSFISEMEKREAIQKKIFITPEKNEGVNTWEREEAYSWIFADTCYYPLMERAIDGSFVLPPITQQLALPFFTDWSALDKDVLRYQWKTMKNVTLVHLKDPSDNYGDYVIRPPKKDQNLFDYLMEISQKLSKNKGCKDSFWRSLRSFLRYLIEHLPEKEIGFIEEIFPKWMKRGDECVLRIIKDTQSPIDFLLTAQILKNMAQHVISGPENIKKVAAQALAFSWICLYSAHARLMPEEKLLHSIRLKHLKEPIFNIVHPWSDHKYPTLILPSFFGDVEIPISCTLGKFLSFLPYNDSQRVFSSPLPSLRRAFNRAVKEIPEIEDLGKITFLRITSFPHEHIQFLTNKEHQVP